MAQLLITGGAGYIGSACATLCLQRGHRVVVLDDLSTGFRDAVPPGAVFYQAGIGDTLACEGLLQQHRIDAVFHFAAKALIPESVVNPGVFFERNLADGIRFFETLRRHDVRRLILSSTAAVYGNPLEIPISENHPTRPLNAYGESKLGLERVLQWYATAYQWSVVALRYFSAAGALPECGERHTPETHVLPLALASAAGLRPDFVIYGDDYPTPDGTCQRDFVHVRDLIEAHLLCLEALPAPGFTAFNVGSGRMYSIREIIAATERVCGTSLRVRVAERRAGDPAQLCASPQRLMAALGWVPRHSDLCDILADAWRWTRRSVGAGAGCPQ